MSKSNDIEAWRATGEAAVGKIAPVSFAGEQWNFVLGNGAELFAKLNEQPVRVRDVAGRIGQGIRTSANPIYVLNLRGESGHTVTAFSEQLQREVKLERKALSPFLQGQDIRRYVLETCSQVVILPYEIKSGRAEFISEGQFRKTFSRWLMLICLKTRKSWRSCGNMDECAVRIGMLSFIPKNLELMSASKILVPDIANFASFAFDEAGEFAFTSGYGITLKEDANMAPGDLLGLLNSRLLDFYLKKSAKRCVYFRYFTQFIEQLPIS